jgi:hydrogenase maturation protease
MSNLREQLEQNLSGRVCFMGLGNTEYGDDGFGVRLAEELIAAGLPDVVIAGTTPDRWIGQILDFDQVLFLDAVDWGGTPGSAALLNSTEVTARFPQVSTHKISLGVLAKWVEMNGTTRAWLLGVQPESLKPSLALTPTIETTLQVLTELLCSLACEEQLIGADRR